MRSLEESRGRDVNVEVLKDCTKKAWSICNFLSFDIIDFVSLEVSDLSPGLRTNQIIQAAIVHDTVLLGLTLRSKKVGLGMVLNC